MLIHPRTYLFCFLLCWLMFCWRRRLVHFRILFQYCLYLSRLQTTRIPLRLLMLLLDVLLLLPFSDSLSLPRILIELNEFVLI